MLRKIFVIAIILLGASFSSYAQIDKTVTKYLDAGIKSVKAEDYEQALTQFNTALETALQVYPDSSMAVIACKSQLANVYFNLHDFTQALSLFKTVANYQREDFGPESYEYASQLSHIAACYASLGEFGQAIDYAQSALVIQEKCLDDDHLDYIFTLNSLAEYYSYDGQNEKAIETAKEVAEFVGEAWGKDGEDYITSLEFLFDRYVDAEEYSLARDLGHDILKRNSAFYGDKSIPYGQALSNMVPVYQHLDSYQDALKCGLESISVFDFNKKRVHPFNYVELYERLADVYDAFDDPQNHLACRKRVVEYEEQNYDNPTHIHQLANSYCNLSYAYEKCGDSNNALVTAQMSFDYAKQLDLFPNIYVTACSRLAIAYSNLGQLDKAVKLTEETIRIIDNEEFGEKLKLNAIRSLSCYYDELRQSAKSLEYGELFLAGAKTLFGDSSIEYAEALSNLGAFNCHAGNYSAAVQYGQQAMLLLEQLHLNDYDAGYLYAHIANTMGELGEYEKELQYLNTALDYFSVEKYPAEFASAMDNMAMTYCRMNDYSSALPLANKAMEIRKGLNGENNPMYAYSLNNMAHIYTELGDYKKALEYDEEAAEIRKRLNGETSPLYIASLHNLAVDFDKLKMTDKAVSIDSIALCLALQVFEPDAPEIIYANYQLADDYYQSGQYDKAVPYLRQYFDLQSNNIIKSLKGLNSGYKQSFWEKHTSRIERATHFAIQLADWPDMARVAYNSMLMMKGLLLTSAKEFERLIDAITDPILLPLVSEYKDLKNRLTSDLYLSRDEQKSFYQRVISLEDQLIRYSPSLTTYTSSIESTWEDIRDNLKDGELAVEFFLDDYYGYDTYCAMVLRNDWDAPKIEYICLKEYIDRLNSMGPQMFTGQFTELGYEGIWKPLEQYVSGGERIYFATDDLMQQTNIEVFGLGIENSLTNKCDLVRLSSTREICDKIQYGKPSTAVIYGGLTYDIDLATHAQLYSEYSVESTSLSRDLQSLNETRAGWKYLPYTAIEAEAICGQLTKGEVSTTLFKGETGTEESFKSLSGKNVSIFHLATHGFFLNDVEKTNIFLGRFSEGEEDNIIDPMLRSGLIVSGGQAAWLGNDVPKGIEDGILLSKELSELDLSHIDVVVLSACNTGLGDVKNDGVFGLQRAFKLAGAQTIIMSLWEIDDNVTSVFMEYFYQNLLSGSSRHDAFKQARNSIQKEYTNPYYWAAFIMLD